MDNGNSKLTRFTTNGVFRIVRDLGFPIVIALLVIWAYWQKDKQFERMQERTNTVIENNTKVLNNLDTSIKELRWIVKTR